MKLSDEQKKIVASDEKYICVLAGAGSGKTRVLTERIKKLISKGRPSMRVLAMTFSNKAAEELKERLSEDFDQDKIEERTYVGTIHGFCMKIISQRGHTIGLPNDLHIFEHNDCTEIFKEALNNVLWAKPISDNFDASDKDSRRLFDKISQAKRNYKFPSDFNDEPWFKTIYQEYNDLMLSQNAIDFDDLLIFTYRIFMEVPAVARIYREIYTSILIDEAQDLNRAQYELIKAIAGQSAEIFMVGDPNQAIYGFNDASSDYFSTQFNQDFKTREYTMKENFRSSKSVIAAAETMISKPKMTTRYPIKGEFSIESFKDEKSEAEGIVDKIKTLLEHGHPDVEGEKISTEKCSVLARNKYIFKYLKEELDSNGIKYNVREATDSGPANESLFFKVFNLSLRLLTNENDIIHFNKMLSLLEIDDESIGAFSDFRNERIVRNIFEIDASEILERAWTVLSEDECFPFRAVLEDFESYCKNENNFKNDNENLMFYNDYKEWETIWKKYCDLTSIETRTLKDLLNSISLGMVNTSDTSGITLSTVHKSKGLEFDVLFIMGLNEGVFPDYRSLEDEEKMREEKHNMFVAITRSKRLCYLSYPEKKVMPWGGERNQKPSRFVDQLSKSIEYESWS